MINNPNKSLYEPLLNSSSVELTFSSFNKIKNAKKSMDEHSFRNVMKQYEGRINRMVILKKYINIKLNKKTNKLLLINIIYSKSYMSKLKKNYIRLLKITKIFAIN